MINLSTNRSLEVLLSTGVTTTALPVNASWIEVRTSDQAVNAFGDTDNSVTGTGVVTLVEPCGFGLMRGVKSLQVYNADSTGATVTIRKNNGLTTRILIKVLLAVGDTLEYVDD